MKTQVIHKWYDNSATTLVACPTCVKKALAPVVC